MTPGGGARVRARRGRRDAARRVPTRGAGSAAAPTTASCAWRGRSPTWPAARRSAASRWPRPCSCAGGTASERATAPAPTACAARGCSPTWRPTSRRSPRGAVGLALARTAAPLQRGPGCGGRAEGRRRRSWPRSVRCPSSRLRADLLAAQCWACCRHDPRFPVGLRDAADAPWALIGRGDPALAGAARAGGDGDDRRRPAGQHLRSRGGARARSRTDRRRPARRQRPRLRHRRLCPSRCARGRHDRRRARLRRRRRLSRPRTARSGGGSASAASSSRSCRRGPGAWRWTFPARNRIMAALAGMTVVVEAAQRSGSLITADLAADLGRDLGAVPGPVNSRASAGTNDLLAGGACLIRDAQDVLDAMLGPGVRKAERAGADLDPRLRDVLGGAGARGGDLRRDRRRARPRRRRGRLGSGHPRGARLRLLLAGRRLLADAARAARHLGCASCPPSAIPAVLSIAGSDSGGGAGIQADLKAFARCGVHGMTAITAITAQNTVGVEAVEAVSPEMIVAQVGAVAEDIGVDAVKIGMLGTAETVDAVVEALRFVGEAPVVIDPVMVAESGAVLLDEEARAALVERLLPLATVVTPNIPEARALSGAGEQDSQEDLAREVLALGPARGRRHRRPQRADRRSLLRRSRVGRDRRRAASRRRRARLRLHPLLGAGRLPRPRRDAAGGGAEGARGRLRRGRRRPARDRRGAGPGRRLRPRPLDRLSRFRP